MIVILTSGKNPRAKRSTALPSHRKSGHIPPLFSRIPYYSGATHCGSAVEGGVPVRLVCIQRTW